MGVKVNQAGSGNAKLGPSRASYGNKTRPPGDSRYEVQQIRPGHNPGAVRPQKGQQRLVEKPILPGKTSNGDSVSGVKRTNRRECAGPSRIAESVELRV